MSLPENYERRKYAKGDIVISEGVDGESAYLVESGAVEVYRTVNGEDIILSKLGSGEIFGETALLFDEPRSASVRCVNDSKIIVMSRNIFHEKLNASHPTVQAIVKMLSRRVLSANESLIKEQRDLQSLVEATRVLFENVCDDLPAIKKRVFEEGVRPKFEEFISAVESLEDRFEVFVEDE